MKNLLIKIYNKLTDKTKEFPFSDVKSFCEKTGNSYKVLASEQECEELRPCIWKIRDTEEKIPRKLPETYIAEIKDATVFGENDLLISKGTVLSDVFAHKYADKMQLTKRITKAVDLKKKTVILNYHNYRKLPIEYAFDLTSIFSYNYYHFMVNVLPKLYYLEQCEEYKDCPLLVDKRAYGSFKKIIDIYNIHNRKIICVGSDTAFRVKRLIVSSNSAWYDKFVLENFFGEIGHAYDKYAIQFVRERALSKINSETKLKRVYVSRKNVPQERRRLENEMEIEALFNRYGFVSVCPEQLSFLEQVKLFSETEVFAGVSGAAYTNIMFLPKNATIMYFTCLCGNSGENLYPSLWNTVGDGKFIILQGTVTNNNEQVGLKDNLRKIELNMSELEAMLKVL